MDRCLWPKKKMSNKSSDIKGCKVVRLLHFGMSHLSLTFPKINLSSE